MAWKIIFPARHGFDKELRCTNWGARLGLYQCYIPYSTLRCSSIVGTLLQYCVVALQVALQYCRNDAAILPCNIRVAMFLQYCRNIAHALPLHCFSGNDPTIFCNIARTSTYNVPVAMPKQNCAHIAMQYCSENIVETLQQYSEAIMTLTKFVEICT